MCDYIRVIFIEAVTDYDYMLCNVSFVCGYLLIIIIVILWGNHVVYKHNDDTINAAAVRRIAFRIIF